MTGLLFQNPNIYHIWTHKKSNQYKMAQHGSWMDAFLTCRRLKSHLIVLENEREMDLFSTAQMCPDHCPDMHLESLPFMFFNASLVYIGMQLLRVSMLCFLMILLWSFSKVHSFIFSLQNLPTSCKPFMS